MTALFREENQPEGGVTGHGKEVTYFWEDVHFNGGNSAN